MPVIKYKTERQRKKADNRRKQEYHQRSMKMFAIRLHNESDAEVIAKLDSVDNKTDYIRQLILKDIEENG